MRRRLLAMILALLLCGTLCLGGALADEEDADVSDETVEETAENWEELTEEDEEMENPFADVSDDAAYVEAVCYLAKLGIFVGDEKGNFNPEATITRAETAIIICRLLGVEDEAKKITVSAFADVADDHWAMGHIAKAVELGIINGDGTGNFRPGDPVTYEQVVKMLVCAWGYGDWAMEEGGWPGGYLTVAEELGVLDPAVAPAEPSPRSVVATLCYEMLQAGEVAGESEEG